MSVLDTSLRILIQLDKELELQPTTIKTGNKPLVHHQQMAAPRQRVQQHQKQAATAIVTRTVPTETTTTTIATTTILAATILVAAQMGIPIQHQGAPQINATLVLMATLSTTLTPMMVTHPTETP